MRDAQAVAADYELHFGVTPINADGNFENTGWRSGTRNEPSPMLRGHWGGTFSNVPDQSGNPRLVAGFSGASIEESDAAPVNSPERSSP